MPNQILNVLRGNDNRRRLPNPILNSPLDLARHSLVSAFEADLDRRRGGSLGMEFRGLVDADAPCHRVAWGALFRGLGAYLQPAPAWQRRPATPRFVLA